MLENKFKHYMKQQEDRLEVNETLKQDLGSKMEIGQHKKRFSLFTKIRLIGVGSGFALVVLAVVVMLSNNPYTPLLPAAEPSIEVAFGEKIDDWAFDASIQEESAGLFGGRGGGFTSGLSSLSSGTAMQNAQLGFSVGGAKDIESFRQNIQEGFLPLFDSITYEGLFYEYFFDTGKEQECDELFCASYSKAISNDPISGEPVHYLSVGLNSGINVADFKRKPLNLVIVLDISGSMGSSFDQYYYDSLGDGIENNDNKKKIDVAKESLIDLLEHLNPEDRLGIVLFDDEAYEAKPLRYVGESDIQALEKHIMELSEQGGTNMEAGMDLASKQFDSIEQDDRYDNRIIFLTDAMPNTGVTDKDGLVSLTKENANDDLYTTFIGIGIDFQSELVEALTKIEGANYYSVHSSEEFARRMDEGFEYMVTPLVFDLRLELASHGFEIEHVYGSPEADKATGEIMYVSTLFPSLSVDGETRGGLVLLKLNKTSEDEELMLKVTYRDREGVEHTNESTVVFNESNEFYENAGIRKGIVLSRYADLVKNWISDTRADQAQSPRITPTIMGEIGIITPEPILSEWEQTSVPLTVSDAYRSLFSTFETYLQSEISAIGDQNMQQELEIVRTLGS